MDQYLLLYMYDVRKISALKQGYELAEYIVPKQI